MTIKSCLEHTCILNLIAKLNHVSEIERTFKEFSFNQAFTDLNFSANIKYVILYICNQKGVEIFSEPYHCIKYQRIRFFTDSILRVFFLIRENTSQ